METTDHAKEVPVLGGEHLNRAAEKVVTAALESGGRAFCMFNGIRLEAGYGTIASDLVSHYQREMERQQKEYAASPEGIRAKAEAEAERTRLQHRADQLMANLLLLDFTDLDKVLSWLCAMEEPRDRIGVNVPTALIVNTFKLHGYEPNANCEPDFDENNRENYARWIIGQAISEPYVPMVNHFTEKWRQRFN